MSIYAYLDGNTWVGPVSLRSRHAGIGGWHLLTDADRAEHGWYPAVTVNEQFDPVTHSRSDAPTSYTLENGVVTITYGLTEKDTATVRQHRLAELADLRWHKERAGTSFNGLPIPTDDGTRANITAARIKASADATYTVRWKMPNGFTTLDAATIIAVSDAIHDHVQACFDREDTHTAALEALTDRAAIRDYDITTGWPGDG